MDFYLPEDLILAILLRIPAKDLVRFKRVCKHWYYSISDPNFANAHLHRSPAKILLSVPSKLGYSFNDEYFSCVIENKHTMVLEKLHLNNALMPISMLGNVFVKAGCNGLLLIQQDTPRRRLCVCNLVTRQCTLLPDTETSITTNWVLFYDSSVAKYRVFGISGRRAMILTAGDHEWSDITTPNWYMTLSPPLFSGKELHWLVDDYDEYFIYSMDVTTKEFTKIMLPPWIGMDDDYCMEDVLFLTEVKQGVLCLTRVQKQGVLCLTRVQIQIDVWVLEDKVKGLWTNYYSIGLQSLSNICERWDYKCIVGMKNLDSDDISDMLKLFVHDGDKLFCHDLKTHELKHIADIAKNHWVSKHYHFYSETLVSWHPVPPSGNRQKLSKITEGKAATTDDNQGLQSAETWFEATLMVLGLFSSSTREFLRQILRMKQ